MDAATRVCSDCKLAKPLDLFPRDRTQARGFGYRCRECTNRRGLERRGTLAKHEERAALAAAGKKRCAKCREVRSQEEFRARKDAADGLTPWCRGCLNAASNESMKALWHAPERKAVRALQRALRWLSRPPVLSRVEIGRRYVERNPDRARENRRGC